MAYVEMVVFDIVSTLVIIWYNILSIITPLQSRDSEHILYINVLKPISFTSIRQMYHSVILYNFDLERRSLSQQERSDFSTDVKMCYESL